MNTTKLFKSNLPKWQRKRTRALSENFTHNDSEFIKPLRDINNVHGDLLRISKNSSKLVKKFIKIMLNKARNCMLSYLSKE